MGSQALTIRNCLKDSKVLFASCLGIGFIKKAPGTFGSLFALLPLYVFAHLNVPKALLVPFFLMLTVISSFICQFILKQYEIDDPGWVVIDEFLGMYLGYLCFPQTSWISLILLFIFFRFFDILKPWPISLADKMKTGFGVILDDLIAGIFAGLIVLFTGMFLNIN